MDAEAAIHEIVDRETRGCNTKDVPLLLSVFHPDMVWAWPATYTSYDPFEWCLVLGKFDPERWRFVYEELFETRTLVHNRRETVRIEISAQGDGAFAVVDIDTSPAAGGPRLQGHSLPELQGASARPAPFRRRPRRHRLRGVRTRSSYLHGQRGHER
jgi:hypothetical protein